MAPPSTTSSTSYTPTPSSIPSTPVEEQQRSLSLERAQVAAAAAAGVDVKPTMPLPKALYPFRHAPESPRSLPSLYSGASSTELSTNSACPSPIPSPSLSPHGTPHAFFGHDLLPISYPPVPYPPTDAWDNVEEMALPGPAFAFDLLRFEEFKLGGRDGWLTGLGSEMMSVEVSVGTGGDSLGLGMELDGGELGDGESRKRMRMSEQEGPTGLSTMSMASGLAVSTPVMDLLAEVKKEPVEEERWAPLEEVTSGWGL